MRNVEPSPIRRIHSRALQLEAAGQDIIHLELGDPDFDSPAVVKRAAMAALRDGDVHYTPNAGYPQLREAIAKKLRTENGVEVDPESEVIVTVGSNEAIACAMLALVNPGDEVLVPSPAWPHYRNAIAIAGGRVVDLPLHREDAYQIDVRRLRELISRRTRVIVVNSPHNPTGAVQDRQVLEELESLALEARLTVISDEIYDGLVFSGRQASIAAYPDAGSVTLTIGGFSKRFAMTGWRIGYACGPADVIGVMLKAHQYLTTSACSFGQRGAIAALTEWSDECELMRRTYQERASIVVAEMRKCGAACHAPEGGLYAFPDFGRIGMDSNALADYLLEAGVSVCPGAAFGLAGEGHIRVSFSRDSGRLLEGLGRITGAVGEIVGSTTSNNDSLRRSRHAPFGRAGAENRSSPG